MSLKTWKKKFYSKKPSKNMTAKEAVEHSLKKWTGLLSHNLEKHNVETGWFGICDPDSSYLDSFSIDGSSCALCVKYFNDDDGISHNESCKDCPLSQTLGKPCDLGDRAPYRAWTKRGNAVPMVRALMKTLENIDNL